MGGTWSRLVLGLTDGATLELLANRLSLDELVRVAANVTPA